MSNVATIQVFGQLGADAKFTPLDANPTRGRMNLRIGSNFYNRRTKASEPAWYSATVFTGVENWNRVGGMLGKGAKVLVWGQLQPLANTQQGGRDYLNIEEADFAILEKKELAGGVATAPPAQRYVFDPQHPAYLLDTQTNQWVTNPTPGQAPAVTPPPAATPPPAPAPAYAQTPAPAPVGYATAPAGAPAPAAPGAAYTPPQGGYVPPAPPPAGAPPGQAPGGQPPF